MSKYWLISDRNNGGIDTSLNIGGLAYWVSDGGLLNNIGNWQKVTPIQFRTLLAGAADAFPVPAQGDNENQSHVTLLVHGFNVSFDHSTAFYEHLLLAASAGLKHFGTCRFGRVGLAHRRPLVSSPPETDNVGDVDCSSFFPPGTGGLDNPRRLLCDRRRDRADVTSAARPRPQCSRTARRHQRKSVARMIYSKQLPQN